MRPAHSRRALPGVLFLALLGGVAAIAGPPQIYDLSWYTIDNGGGRVEGATYVLNGTIGQPDAGLLVGNQYVLAGGFWSQRLSVVVFPDCNADTVIDLGDHDCFYACLNGSDQGILPGCMPADFDQDIDVDLADFAILQNGF